MPGSARDHPQHLLHLLGRLHLELIAARDWYELDVRGDVGEERRSEGVDRGVGTVRALYRDISTHHC